MIKWRPISTGIGWCDTLLKDTYVILEEVGEGSKTRSTGYIVGMGLVDWGGGRLYVSIQCMIMGEGGVE